jgi:DNA-binding Xre family transcriptional regulator
MAVKNLIASALEKKGLSKYKFWQSSGLARVTAYRLVDDPYYVPGGEVFDKVCHALNCQPGELLIWVPNAEEGKDAS